MFSSQFKSEALVRYNKIFKALQASDADALLLNTNVNIYYAAGQIFSGYIYIDKSGNMLYFVKRPVGLKGEPVVYIRKPEEIPAILQEAEIPLPSRIALELDYIARYGSSADDGNWQYLTVAEAIALNADELPPRFVEKLEDRLLDEDLSPEMRELTLHALTLQQSRMFAYYVVNGRLYRMDVRVPGELLDLPEKFEPLLDAYGIIKVKSAIRGRNEPRKLDDAARYLVKAIKKYKIMDKISEPVVLVKMFKFFVEHYDFDNGEELAKACCAVDKIDAEVDIDDLYY